MKTEILSKIQELKRISGSHSPSIGTIIEKIPEIKIDVDACFLSNPYATDLFLNYVKHDLIDSNNLRSVLEFYPPQNYDISYNLAQSINISPDNLFIGNGAIEIIQAVLHRFVTHSLCIILPTFSSYYEFVNPNTEVFYYPLKKENKFQLNIEDYIKFIKDNKIRNIVIINPNNPNGGYISKEQLQFLIEELVDIDNIIIDESFIHFAYENSDMYQVSNENLINKYPNLIFIKSMSKDFGIAGVRAGYGIMSSFKSKELLKNGYLWNVSGFADYFFKLYCDKEFQEKYEIVRKKYIMNTQAFLNDLHSLNNIIVYPSKANFALVEILNEMTSFDFAMELLYKNGVYVRDCSDKIGLEGQFVRIASRTFEENLQIIQSLKEIL